MMRTGRILILFFAATFFVNAAAPPHGKARLRELAVFPKLNLTFGWGFDFQGGTLNYTDNNADPLEEIARLRQELKQQPDNIQRFLQLGGLLDQNNETNESQICYQKAEQLCRNRLTVNPRDGLILSDLGQALLALNKKDEAESVSRRATLISSNEWKCWVCLGQILENRSIEQLFPQKSVASIFALANSAPQKLLNYRPPPSALERAEASSSEAAKCFDRAVAAAPKEADVFVCRAGYKIISNLENLLIQHFRSNDNLEPNKLRSIFFFTKTAVPDIQQAARLSPNNYKIIGMAACFEWINAVVQAMPQKLTFDTLPYETRRSIREAMTRLENLSLDSDKRKAAGALEFLGCLNMTISGSDAAGCRAAEPYFRRAVSLDPSRDTSWNMLLGVLHGESAPSEDMVTVCESRLKYKNSAWNHLLLAKTLQKQEQWAKATEQAAAAIKLETNNVAARLMLFALCIRQSSDPKYLTIADQDMHSFSTNALNEITSEDEKADRAREILLNTAILWGLNDQPERAKELLRTTVLKKNPDDKDAREIMSVLE